MPSRTVFRNPLEAGKATPKASASMMRDKTAPARIEFPQGILIAIPRSKPALNNAVIAPAEIVIREKTTKKFTNLGRNFTRKEILSFGSREARKGPRTK